MAEPKLATNRQGRLMAVLLVEDEAIVAIAAQDALEELGCEVVGCADSADEAERLAASSPPDLILMDVRLKGPRDGIEAAIRLRERHAAPIIFVTGVLDSAVWDRINQVAPPTAVLQKPYSQAELLNAIVWAAGQPGL